MITQELHSVKVTKMNRWKKIAIREWNPAIDGIQVRGCCDGTNRVCKFPFFFDLPTPGDGFCSRFAEYCGERTTG